MTKNQAFKKTFLYLAVILLGVVIGFKTWWTKSEARYLGLLAFLMVTFGCLFISISLTRLLIASNIDFDSYTLTDKERFLAFKKNNGHSVVTKISTLVTCIFLTLIGITFFLFAKVVNEYKITQLSNYGVRQKVVIKKIIHKGKRSKYAVFDFVLNDEWHSNDLEIKGYSVGDSVDIIFSSQHPDIIDWSDDFIIK